MTANTFIMSNTSDIRLIQLNSYVRPEIKENGFKEYVLNGNNNEFYDYILEQYKGSPTNASIINTFASLMYGKGLDYKNRQNTTNWLKLLKILDPKELKKVIKDFCVFGGEATLQITKTRGGEINEIAHVPNSKIAPNKVNDDNIIDSYWFCEDWKNTSKYPPVQMPAFGYGKKTETEIYKITSYDPKGKYFSDPCYISILQYCEIEKEMANFYLTSIKKGLSAGYIINVPDGNSLTPEEKTEFETQIKRKLTGSPNAMSFVISFNGRDAEINIVPFPVNDNMHKQWESLEKQCTQKILTGHGVTSPSIVGIISSSGFSNTADEMDTAREQLLKYVIAPKQNEITDAIEDILLADGIVLDLVFKQEKQAETVDVAMSSDIDLTSLGESDIDGYEVVDIIESDNNNINENTLNGVFNFSVRTLDYDKPKKTKSEQDTDLFKVRYKYAGNPNPEREFCKKMMQADKLYRFEDLNKEQKTTPKMGEGGKDTYNPFLFKGGVNCKHFWQRVILLKKGNKKISVNQARKMILELDPRDRKDADWEKNNKKVAQIAEKKNNYWSLDPNYRK